MLFMYGYKLFDILVQDQYIVMPLLEKEKKH